MNIPRPTRRHLLAAGAAAALTLGASTLLPITNAMAATGCAVTYTAGSWTGGFSANITIKNLGDAVNGWTLGFTFPDPGQRVCASIMTERPAALQDPGSRAETPPA